MGHVAAAEAIRSFGVERSARAVAPSPSRDFREYLDAVLGEPEIEETAPVEDESLIEDDTAPVESDAAADSPRKSARESSAQIGTPVFTLTTAGTGTELLPTAPFPIVDLSADPGAANRPGVTAAAIESSAGTSAVAPVSDAPATPTAVAGLTQALNSQTSTTALESTAAVVAGETPVAVDGTAAASTGLADAAQRSSSTSSQGAAVAETPQQNSQAVEPGSESTTRSASNASESVLQAEKAVEPVRTERATGQSEESTEPEAGELSGFQRKVQKVLDRAREESSGQASSNGKRGGASVAAGKGASAYAARLAAAREHATGGLDSIKATAGGETTASVSGGTGDGPAAAIGRFLVHAVGGATDSGAISASSALGAAGSTATGSLNAAAPSSAAPAADTFGQIIASGVESTDGIEGVVRMLFNSARPGSFEATLNLDPPELGQLNIRIRMQAQAMTLHVEADTAAAGKLIESRLGELRDALAVHGIRIDRSEVVVRPAPSADVGEQARQEGGGSAEGDADQNSFSRTDPRDFAGDGGGAYDQRADDSETAGAEAGILAEAEREGDEGIESNATIAERSVDLVA